MLSAVSPIWDETWLIAAGVILWGAFPVVYATLFSAFYLPLLLMPAVLILRGVAFECRYKAERMPGIWDAAFAGGSLATAFVQGIMVGALVEGLPISSDQYTAEFAWFSPFALLCGIGLCLGYALLDAYWLVRGCLSTDPASRGWPARVAGRRIRLCDDQGPLSHAPMARAAIPVHLPGDWCHRGTNGGPARPQSAAWNSVVDGGADFRGSVRQSRRLVLALYDPVLDHDRGSGGTAFDPRLHVLGRGFRYSVFRGKVRPTATITETDEEGVSQ
jgi:Cytochrome bd terminal oxidase subunit II